MAGMDALRAALAAASDIVMVPLADQTVHVKAPKDWPSSAMRAVNQGDFETWAEKCLVRDGEQDDYRAVWQAVDPTMEQVVEFFAAYEKAAGAEPGK